MIVDIWCYCFNRYLIPIWRQFGMMDGFAKDHGIDPLAADLEFLVDKVFVVGAPDTVVGIVPHDRLWKIQREMPNLAHILWFSTLLDAAMHREWIFRLRRLNALGRVAHFFAETEHRLAAIDRVKDGRFDLPRVQVDLAEATGITPIHFNRCLRDLRKQGITEFREGKVTVHERKQLWKLGEFDPAYLF